jgi:SAM-dependent methyltransferase
MQSNWQETFFRGVALDAWRRIINPEMTRTEVDFLERALGVDAGAQLLDVPCGNGRHAIELAGRGYNITALDLSDEFIAEARGATHLPVRWIRDDMRSLAWVSEFDGAYCFGNSFGYLPWEEAGQFLASVARALKPGARFIVDTGMAAESILPSLARTRWFRLGDILMLSENRYHASESRLDIDYTFVQNGRVETRPTASYIFTVGELCRMHREAGLRPVDLFSSTNAEPYQLGSPRLILVSSKISGSGR